jgi:hypothetical protein
MLLLLHTSRGRRGKKLDRRFHKAVCLQKELRYKRSLLIDDDYVELVILSQHYNSFTTVRCHSEVILSVFFNNLLRLSSCAPV